MEKSTPTGLLIGLGLVFGTIFMGDGWQTFFEPASLLIVVGGCFGALLVAFTLSEVKAIPGALKEFFGFQPPDYTSRVTELVELARVARRDGIPCTR